MGAFTLFWYASLSFSHSYTSARIGITLRNSPSISDHERRKIVGTLTVITIIFILVFGPYHMVGGYRFVALMITQDQCTLERSIYLYYRICYGLTSLNTLLDPLFYIFLCQNARLELQKSLPCLSRSSMQVWESLSGVIRCKMVLLYPCFKKHFSGLLLSVINGIQDIRTIPGLTDMTLS